jgi:hypothetical protein
MGLSPLERGVSERLTAITTNLAVYVAHTFQELLEKILRDFIFWHLDARELRDVLHCENTTKGLKVVRVSVWRTQHYLRTGSSDFKSEMLFTHMSSAEVQHALLMWHACQTRSKASFQPRFEQNSSLMKSRNATRAGENVICCAFMEFSSYSCGGSCAEQVYRRS